MAFQKMAGRLVDAILDMTFSFPTHGLMAANTLTGFMKSPLLPCITGRHRMCPEKWRLLHKPPEITVELVLRFIFQFSRASQTALDTHSISQPVLATPRTPSRNVPVRTPPSIRHFSCFAQPILSRASRDLSEQSSTTWSPRVPKQTVPAIV